MSRTGHFRRAARLTLAYRILGWVMLALTAALGVLWVLPKGDGGLWWLLCVVPALAFLVGVLVTKSDIDEPMLTKRFFGWGAAMACGWFGGAFFVGDTVSALTESWQLLHFFWPWVMVLLVVARFVLARIEPWAARRDASARLRHRQLEIDDHVRRKENARATPSAPGRMTGCEPDQLLEVHYLPGPHMLGSPGASGDQLARALHKTGQLERFATFWSVRTPEEDERRQTDVDCVLVTGRSLFLLDVKNFAQGDVTWVVEQGDLQMIDNPTDVYVGETFPRSPILRTAARRLGKSVSDLGVRSRIEPLVVFMPTEGGLGTIKAVQWPGDVPAVGLDDLLSLLRQEPDFDPTSDDGAPIIDTLRPLVRATPSPELTAPPPTESLERPACPACGEPYEEGLTYCLECGQVRRS